MEERIALINLVDRLILSSDSKASFYESAIRTAKLLNGAEKKVALISLQYLSKYTDSEDQLDTIERIILSNRGNKTAQNQLYTMMWQSYSDEALQTVESRYELTIL